jgi:hypothetical protein
MHRLFKELKATFFNDFVINVHTMEIEVKENSEGQEKLQELWRKWNKVLRKKFDLKWYK